MTRTPDRLAGALLLLFAAFAIREAARLPYRLDQAPGPGFVPLWLGITLAGAAGLVLIGTFLEAGPPAAGEGRPGRRDPVALTAVSLGAAGAALGSGAVGLPLASGAYMLLVLSVLQPERRALNGAMAIGTPLVVWLVFVRWLAVPLPRSPWGF